uniref:Wsv133-like protein n=1 Tax=Pasiphaea japonica whispovirus TaxID=2984286 RepID=A0A9C7C9R0_9VIRU|nr:MAG: wsv133-like protein [Pasiphaea japonica whispovirus]
MSGEVMSREFSFIHTTLSSVMKDKKNTVLKRLCADDARNVDKDGCCSFCGRQGYDTSASIPLDNLIDISALVGLVTSIGTIVNTHLSTSCSRLQKQAQSYAALTCGSYMDVVYTGLNKTPEQIPLDAGAGGLYNTADDDHVSGDNGDGDIKVTKIGHDDEYEIYEEGDQYEEKYTDDQTPSKETNDFQYVPITVGLYNCQKFENEYIRIPFFETSLHAETLKYNQEYKFCAIKDNIPVHHNVYACNCAQSIQNSLSVQ